MLHPAGPRRLRAALETEALLQTPQVTLLRNSEAIVEGCAGVLRYDETAVTLNCPPLMLELTGFDLRLDRLQNGDLRVSGTVTALQLSEL
ncbi:MAG: YabP/YqfC family sporulation protein [Clostridia bacterium]|nr:YabP/YqfC family sporulation protein [Clostridia bacterium]